MVLLLKAITMLGVELQPRSATSPTDEGGPVNRLRGAYLPSSPRVDSSCGSGAPVYGRRTMSSDMGAVRISVEVADDAERRELLTATSALQQELSSGGRVESSSSAASPGAKGAGALDPGTLVVFGAFTASMLRALVRVATAYIDRRGAKSIVIEADGDKLVISGGSGRTERAVVDAWVERRVLAVKSVTGRAMDGTSDPADEG